LTLQIFQEASTIGGIVSEKTDLLQDVFRLFGRVDVRKMFGGHGIFRDGLMFGLLYHDLLYLKADAENVSPFEEQDLPQFEYLRQGQVTKLSYYLAPDPVMDDCVEAAIWARRSYEAALRGHVTTMARKRRTKRELGKS